MVKFRECRRWCKISYRFNKKNERLRQAVSTLDDWRSDSAWQGKLNAIGIAVSVPEYHYTIFYKEQYSYIILNLVGKQYYLNESTMFMILSNICIF